MNKIGFFLNNKIPQFDLNFLILVSIVQMVNT